MPRVLRHEAGASMESRLLFAQCREDPLLEIDALKPRAQGRYVVVASGGCTALSLLARGAGRVDAVDINRSQNHMVELKAAALAALGTRDVLEFVGAAPSGPKQRLQAYDAVKGALGARAREWWDRRPTAIERGVLNAGATESLLRAVSAVLRWLVHPRARQEHLLACRSLAEQAAYYAGTWNSWRWRALFALLINRVVFRGTYPAAFFAHLERPSLSRHFLGTVAHGLSATPVASNYFLHHILKGSYPAGAPGGVPPYLEPGLPWREVHERLALVDGGVTDHLRTLPAGSVDGVVLSNICEWLDTAEREALFGEIARVSRRGAVVCLRNFLGWTEIPAPWAARVRADASSERWIERDRSLMQRRFLRCEVLA